VLADAGTPDAPGWWLMRLGKALSSDVPRMTDLMRYDSGDHPLPVGNRKMRDTYHRLQKMGRSNYTGLVAEAVEERLVVTGFRTGSKGSQATDDDAWGIWQANSLDADCNIVHHQALVTGRSYVIVGADTDPKAPPGSVLITPESPLQVIHESDPARPRRLLAAMKTWIDSIQGRQLAIVYLPDQIHYFQAVSTGMTPVEWDPKTWEVTQDPSANPLGEVPVVPFINRRPRSPMGMGEFEDVTDIQDRINVTILDRLVTQAMQAYRQRWAKGINVEDENGNPQRPFDPGADLLWIVEDENASFGDFQQTDLKPILDACSADIRDLAAISRTPPHYLLADMVNVSGDALTAAESGLTSKVTNRSVEFGEAWEKVLRLAAQYGDGEVGDDSVIVWADPERHSLAELADAAVKYQSAGVPFRERMALLGFTPSEVDRMEAERMKDALVASLNSPMAVDPGAAPGATTTALTAPGQPDPAAPPGAPAPQPAPVPAGK
jgi:hypothetical protein